MLWHYKLGHPKFSYLQWLVPSLFNKNFKNFSLTYVNLQNISEHLPDSAL